MDDQEYAVKNVEGKGEVISLGFGETGTNQLFCFLEEIAKEHNIIPGGKELASRGYDIVQSSNLFFKDNKKARAILVDSGSKTLSKIQDSKVGKLIDKSNFINPKEKIERFYASLYTEKAKSLVNETLETIRKEAEKCSSLSGFQIFHNIGGGVGSGITCSVIKKLSENFPKKIRLTHTTIPEFKEYDYDEALNCFFSVNDLLQISDISNVIRNVNLRNYCKSNNLKSEDEKFNEENRIVGKMAADLTSPMRFKGLESFSLEKIVLYHVPYPRIHFVSPFVVSRITEEFNEKMLIWKLFSQNSSLGLHNYKKGKFISNYSIIRGDFNQMMMEEALKKNYLSNREIITTDWSTNNLYVNILRVEGNSEESAINISNSTNFSEQISTLCNLADTARGSSNEEDEPIVTIPSKYFEKSKGLGMEDAEFSEARMDLASIEKDYEEVAADTFNEEEQEG